MKDVKGMGGLEMEVTARATQCHLGAEAEGLGSAGEVGEDVGYKCDYLWVMLIMCAFVRTRYEGME